ncbi:MAG: NUDIX hydrolase [archaeon]
MKPWKVLDEKEISPSRWFPLFVNRVELPNGKEIDYYFSRLDNVAMVVAITPKKEVVLVRQYKHGVREITLELPAGTVGSHTPEQAAKKELQEETGIVADRLIPIGDLLSSPSKISTRVYGFIATDAIISQKQDLDDTEEIEVVLHPVTGIDNLIKAGRLKQSDSIALLAMARLEYPALFRD